MARRHGLGAGDWESAAVRLVEILTADSGADPFEEGLKLLVARLYAPGAGGARAGIDRALEGAIERWPGILAEPRTRLPEAVVVRAGSVLGGLSFEGDGLAGLDVLCEHLVSRTSRADKGQFFTPRHVVDAVAATVGVKAGDSVHDPACGSGAFLRAAAANAPGCTVTGWDLDTRAIRVARLLLAAMGRPTDAVEERNSLGREGPGAYDVVLTNPPFAGEVAAESAVGYQLAGKGRVERDVLFLERSVDLLRPGGRLGIVLPTNKLEGARFAGLRAWLLARVRVVAVLSLGRHTFQPHTGQRAGVVFGIKRPTALLWPPDAEEILFYRSERSGKDSGGRVLLDGSGGVDHDLAEARAPVRAGMEAAWAS